MQIKGRIMMKLQLFGFLSMGILVCSCSDTSNKPAKQQKEAEKYSSSNNKPGTNCTDTLKISSTAAVLYAPDSIQLEKMKAGTDPKIFESMMHDCFYQLRNSHEVIKKYYPQVAIIEVKNARYLLFEKVAGHHKEYVDLNTYNDPCGIIIFDSNKAPRLVDMTNIETELGFYFSK